LGNLLTWKYIYSWDVAEWESLYQWYREETPILWATGITYMTVGDDLWKILALKITPVNQEGIHWEPAMSDWLYILDPSTNLNNIILRVTVWTANQTLTINKYFDVSNYTVDRWDGTTGTIGAHLTKTYNNIGTYYVELQNPWDRWKFAWANNPLIPQSWTTVDNVKIVYMPSLADWFGESASNPGHNFFRFFNHNWSLTTLPAWSFNTSNITSVGNYFFSFFNHNWSLTTLPAWSFNTSNITSVGNYFFSSFNHNWSLTTLPVWSFDTSNITSVGDYFFSFFNHNWSLTTLPAWSFNTSNITSVGNYFFSFFNQAWSLSSLPAWSFNTSNITSVGNYFFSSFNQAWSLSSLPAW